MGQRACLEEEAVSALEGGLPRGHLLPENVIRRLAVFWDVSASVFDVPVYFRYLNDAYGEYRPNSIVVDPRLKERLVEIVAHELGHHVVYKCGHARGFTLTYRGRSKVVEEIVVEKGAVVATRGYSVDRGYGWKLLALGLYHKRCRAHRQPAPGRIRLYGWFMDKRCPLLH